MNDIFDAVDNLKTYLLARPNLIVALKNKASVKENNFYIRFARDIVLVLLYSICGDDNEEVASIIVSKKNVDLWKEQTGLSTSDIVNYAIQNTIEKRPMKIVSVGSIFGDDDSLLFAITTKGMENGAVSMLYPGFEKAACEALKIPVGSNFYIIPSSIHEVMVLRNDIADPKELEEWIVKVNGDSLCVPEGEMLSNSLFEWKNGVKMCAKAVK